MYNKLREKGIGAQIHYIPIHLQPYNRRLGFKEGDFPRSENYARRSLSLPVYYELENEAIGSTCRVIEEVVNK